jgi:hypothetical protein
MSPGEPVVDLTTLVVNVKRLLKAWAAGKWPVGFPTCRIHPKLQLACLLDGLGAAGIHVVPTSASLTAILVC